jgi:glucose/arabinose dehydrogenase
MKMVFSSHIKYRVNTLNGKATVLGHCKMSLIYMILAITIYIVSVPILASCVSASNLRNPELSTPFPQIESIANKTLVVWQDNSTGNNEIYFHSDDGGSKFSSKKNLSNSTGDSQFPQIESIANRTRVVWQDNSTGNNEIYLRDSTDGGNSFGPPINLSNSTGNSEFPQIESIANRTRVVWQDDSTGNNEIYLRDSTDGGNSFGPPINLSNSTGNSEFPQIESIANRTRVVWQDDSTGNNELYLLVYDRASKFSSKKNLSNSTGDSQFPQIESIANRTLVVWQDNSTGNNEIYVRKSSTEGSKFSSKKNLSNSTGNSQFPQIESIANRTLVVWQDNSTGNNEIYLLVYDGGSKFSSKKNLSNSTGDSQFPQIESIANRTLVVWQDNSTGNNELYIRESTDGGNKFGKPEKIFRPNIQFGEPTVVDSNLKVEKVTSGIAFPTHMDFLGNDDILVLEKNEGMVKRVINGSVLNYTLLDVPVATSVERGMLGIAVQKINNGSTYVFLYFTESEKDGDDISERMPPLGNRLYRYELIENKLVNPKLLLDLPATPGPAHNGGKVLVGPDGNIYLTIGDLNPLSSKKQNASSFTKAQNHGEASNADGRAGILRVTQNGEAVNGGILGHESPLNKYFAYGIRNSFGIDFDPVTGVLWDTENGPQYGDEINLVEPGFNSGWNRVQGFWEPNGPYPGNFTNLPKELVDFNGTSKYSSPEFAWYQPSPGLTAIKFLNSDKLGKKYMNDLFVADFHNGNIYRFELDSSRSGLLLDSNLKDKISNSTGESQEFVFGTGFGGITDLAIGPDGYIYVLSLFQGGADCDTAKYLTASCISYTTELQGTIFRIVPMDSVN